MYTPFNPKLENKVKDKLPKITKCEHCGGNVSIVKNSEVYGKCYGDYPWIYKCCSCDSYVGIHKDTDIPLGSLATKEIRDARKECKPYFFRMIKTLKLSRGEAYKILASKLKIKASQCHFGMFDVDMCNKAKVACLELMNET